MVSKDPQATRLKTTHTLSIRGKEVKGDRIQALYFVLQKPVLIVDIY